MRPVPRPAFAERFEAHRGLLGQSPPGLGRAAQGTEHRLTEAWTFCSKNDGFIMMVDEDWGKLKPNHLKQASGRIDG